MKEAGIYVHIPFCRRKCLYCDFFSGGCKDVDWFKYVSSLLEEFKERLSELNSTPTTLYIGGGTPSLIPDKEFVYLVEGINTQLKKNNNWVEFTVEVNPEDVTLERCLLWKSCGVTRVSMGIQSLNDEELRAIGRSHTGNMALDALITLKRVFDNVTVDLIFGLPGQTIDSWRNTVRSIIDQSPAHISAYSLMFEEGTAMTVLRNQGRLQFPDENECLQMWEYISSKLQENGYFQYEISNYAKPGRESVHNKRYWLGNPYLGLGPGAHSYDGNNIRRENPCKIKGYLDRFRNDDQSEARKEKFYIEENLSRDELMEEKIMLSMRMNQGLDLTAFRDSFGEQFLKKVLKNANNLIERGMVIKAGDRLRLSQAGIMLADEVIVKMIP